MKTGIIALLLFFMATCFLHAEAVVYDPVQTADSELVLGDFENGFQEKYTSDVYNYEGKENPVPGWIENFFNWLFGDGNVNKTFTAYMWFERILYTLVILGVIFIIVKLVMNKEGRWIFGKRSDTYFLNNEMDSADLHQTNFDQLIADAINQKNYRLAIRYYYLYLLQKLADNELIGYHAEKTNADYRNELKNASIISDFTYVSYLYNYIWYGEFEVGQPEFVQAEQAFHQLFKQVKN